MAAPPTLFTNPIKTLYIFSIVLFNYAKEAAGFFRRYMIFFVACGFIAITPRFI